MGDDTGAGAPQAIWINWAERILSFHRVDGYERLEFSTSQEKLDYVFQMASGGFRIQ